MAVSADSPYVGDRSEWSRKYPPLLAVLVALALALAVLPSALNIPETPPTQTLEYAPVPPDDQVPPPAPEGNFTNLGLGRSPAVAGPGDPTGGTIPPIVGRGKTPTTKRCVGNPPRQTEDPVAPPCVAYFEGDNYGATYQGVTEDEIRLLVYIDGFIAETGGSKGQERRPQEQYFDLFKPPKEGEEEHLMVEGFRGWQRYFNERFQTYGRVVHFFLYFTGASKDPETHRANAAENFGTVKPFAVLTDVGENEVDYVEAMAKKGVLNFGSFNGKSSAFFQLFPKLIWGYQPNLEYAAKQYTTYVCKKVLNQPSKLAGGDLNNQPRKLGLWSTSDSSWPGLILLAELVKKQVEECGGEIAVEHNFPVCCFAQDTRTRPDYAAEAMADFKQQGVTTILWTGGIEGNAGKAAQAVDYYPEWILLGDGTFDTNHPVRLSTNTGAFDKHAIAVSAEVFEPALDQQRCYQAFREVNTTRPRADMHYICEYYRNLFQLFTGIQVAGPRLGPTSIDKGFHAIPPVRSKDPTTPACYYNTGDYTCVKDAQAEIWDASGEAPGDNRPGCWRPIEGGARYLPGEWPKGNIDAQITGSEPCNGRSVAVVYRPV